MQTHDAKRVEITIEKAMQSRLTRALQEAGVTGYTILPVYGGSGRSGEWERSGDVTRGSGMVQVVCMIPGEKPDELLNAAFTPVEKHNGVVSVVDCQVLPAERF